MDEQIPSVEKQSSEQPKNISLNQTNPRTTNMISLAIVVAGALIAGAVLYNKPAGNIDSRGNLPTVKTPAISVNIKDVNIEGDPYIGNNNAPVVIAYWSDYQCPWCKKFEVETLPNLITNYVSTGKVKLVFKDFVFLGPDSSVAALYARAVWNLYPDKYMEWRKALFASQDTENSGFGDEPSIAAMTKKINGIDADKVSKEVVAKSADLQKELDNDHNEALKFGIKGTPDFIIGTSLIDGAQSYYTYSNLIEAELKRIESSLLPVN